MTGILNTKLIIIALTGLLFFCATYACGKSRSDTTCLSQRDTILHKTVYLTATSQPEPREGMSSFLGAIVKHLNIVDLIRADISYNSRTLIAFVVEKNGSVGGVRAVYSMGKSGHTFDQAIIGYLKNYKGKWQPAVCNGKPVSFLFIVPLILDIHE